MKNNRYTHSTKTIGNGKWTKEGILPSKRNKMKKVKLIWTTTLIDLAIIAMAVFMSVWQNKPIYLWLLMLLFTTGKNYVVIDEMNKTDNTMRNK